MTRGAVSTPEGVKVADVVWYRAENARALETTDVGLPEFAPDLCVEVRSKRNRKRDIQKKTAAYFGAGVREVWVCDWDGEMTFYSREGLLEHSAICSAFPRHIPSTFLRGCVSTLLPVGVRLRQNISARLHTTACQFISQLGIDPLP